MGNRCADLAVADECSSAVRNYATAGANEADEADVEEEASSDSENAGDDSQDHVFSFAKTLKRRQNIALMDQFKRVFHHGPVAWQKAWLEAEADEAKVHGRNIWKPPDLAPWTLKFPPRLAAGASVTEQLTVPEWMQHNWKALGYTLLGSNHVAVVLVAVCDDKSTRLTLDQTDVDVPFSVLDLGLQSGKSLFQLQIERLLRLQHIINRQKALFRHQMELGNEGKVFTQSQIERANIVVEIPVYVFCSARHLRQVKDFLSANNYFGLESTQVRCFGEAEAPLFDLKGKVMMASKSRMVTTPAGSGSLFSCIRQEGVLSELKSHSIEYLYVSSVENILARVADPTLIGFCRINNASAAARMVPRENPDEPIGILVQSVAERGKPLKPIREMTEEETFAYLNGPRNRNFARILEPFETPRDLAHAKDESTKGLMYKEGDARQFVLERRYFEKTCTVETDVGHQPRCEYTSRGYFDWRRGGKWRDPGQEENAVQMFSFVSDALQGGSVGGLLQPREEHYAIVTPAPGIFRQGPMAQAARIRAVGAMSALHQHWILAAGGVSFGNSGEKQVADVSKRLLCEISPLVSYAGEGLESQVRNSSTLSELPVYLLAREELNRTINHTVDQPHATGSVHFVDELHIVGEFEATLLKEATRRDGGDACREGRPLTDEDCRNPERDSERLPDTPKVDMDEEKEKDNADDGDDLSAWKRSPQFMKAMADVHRHRQLELLDEQKAHGVTTAAQNGDESDEEMNAVIPRGQKAQMETVWGAR